MTTPPGTLEEEKAKVDGGEEGTEDEGGAPSPSRILYKLTQEANVRES